MRHSLADKVVFKSKSMSSAPKRKGEAEKLSGKKKRCLQEGMFKNLLFGKAPTGDSDTKANCGVDLANFSLLFTDEVTFPTS